MFCDLPIRSAIAPVGISLMVSDMIITDSTIPIPA